ncbi:hypothetical protein M0R19_01420 [Candidatus Pacearchaeota archaeon]|jgi:ribosome-associated translation inhibitor RaiA|nr:hypothetical protein [Candidatus Pacearchaeota archaeon]
MTIEIIHAEILTEQERKIAHKLFDEYYLKIKRMIKRDFLLKVHFKEYEKAGKNKKYSLNCEIFFSGKMINSSSWDYDLARAIHKTLKKIETEIEHKFHSSEQK